MRASSIRAVTAALAMRRVLQAGASSNLRGMLTPVSMSQHLLAAHELMHGLHLSSRQG